MFGLSEVSTDVVRGILENISSNKATGLDNLPGRFVKNSSLVFAEPLTHILTLSITTGIIPDELKMARVVPLH